MSTMDIFKQRNNVQEGYSAIAEGNSGGCCGSSSCCGADSPEAADHLAASVGYSPDELAALPQGANLGLSCGNPVALASLKPGETVIDLGSGAGFDIFQAGLKVGNVGRAIGIDMTPAMLKKARELTSNYQQRSGLSNVEFRLGEIENIPAADASADVIISNCVLNLSSEKEKVYSEIERVLKPGGRMAISDMALKKSLPENIIENVQALIGCISGAALIDENINWARQSGLMEIRVSEKSAYIDALDAANDPMYIEVSNALPEGEKLSDYITSIEITGRKTALKKTCC